MLVLIVCVQFSLLNVCLKNYFKFFSIQNGPLLMNFIFTTILVEVSKARNFIKIRLLLC